MNPELEKQLEALIGKISNKEDFYIVRDQLLKRGIESLLKAERIEHRWGWYDGFSGICFRYVSTILCLKSHVSNLMT